MKFNLKNFRLADFLSKRINTILLIVILIIILTGHVVCSCSNVSVKKVVEKFTGKEGAMGKDSNDPSKKQQLKVDAIKKVVAKKMPQLASIKGSSSTPSSTSSSTKPSTTVVSTTSTTEGFTGANTNYGQSAPYLLGSQSGTVALDTNSWNQPDLVVKCDGSYGKGVSDILGRQPQPIPLAEGELDVFATTPFKPECCPNFYSNSTGCACMTTDQYNYLQTRGGNNVPYSEY
jgi:hypothetical protein